MWQEQSGVNYLGLWCFTFAAQALCNGRRERHSGGRSSSSTGYSTAGSSTACPCCDQHNGSTLPGPSHEQSFSIFHFPPKAFCFSLSVVLLCSITSANPSLDCLILLHAIFFRQGVVITSKVRVFLLHLTLEEIPQAARSSSSSNLVMLIRALACSFYCYIYC